MKPNVGKWMILKEKQDVEKDYRKSYVVDVRKKKMKMMMKKKVLKPRMKKKIENRESLAENIDDEKLKGKKWMLS